MLANTYGVVLGLCGTHTVPWACFSVVTHARWGVALGTESPTAGRERGTLGVCNLLHKVYFGLSPNVCILK